MDCRFFLRQIEPLLDGQLDLRTRTEMDIHARDCPDCAGVRQARKRLRDVARASNADERIPDFLGRIIDEHKRRP